MGDRAGRPAVGLLRAIPVLAYYSRNTLTLALSHDGREGILVLRLCCHIRREGVLVPQLLIADVEERLAGEVSPKILLEDVAASDVQTRREG